MSLSRTSWSKAQVFNSVAHTTTDDKKTNENKTKELSFTMNNK